MIELYYLIITWISWDVVYIDLACLCLAIILICIIAPKNKKVSLSIFMALIAYIYLIIEATIIERVNTGIHEYDFIPLHDIIDIIKAGESPLQEKILNIILYVPFGALAYPIANLKKTFLCSISLSFTIETTQLVTTRGMFQTDDIICNVLGSIIGFMLIHLIRKISQICISSFSKD